MSETLTGSSFDVFARVLLAGSGLRLGREKSYLLRQRLRATLCRRSLPDLDALAASLARNADAALAREVVEAMTTNESLFFRDGAPVRAS